MTAKEVLSELEALGTEQNRKIYRRHSAGERIYGVSFANLGKLQKRIKRDHALAIDLWASGYFEARVLAAQIADPEAADGRMLDAWAKDLSGPAVCDYFAGLVVKTRLARQRAEKWAKSKDEWLGRAGWSAIGRLAMEENDLPDAFFEEHLEIIEREIHRSRNRVREAMNTTLIAIGLRNPALEAKAVAAAKRIGKVEVDHGETECKTPDAVAYIARAWARKRARAAGKKA